MSVLKSRPCIEFVFPRAAFGTRRTSKSFSLKRSLTSVDQTVSLLCPRPDKKRNTWPQPRDVKMGGLSLEGGSVETACGEGFFGPWARAAERRGRREARLAGPLLPSMRSKSTMAAFKA